jgi:hypothetical protein
LVSAYLTGLHKEAAMNINERKEGESFKAFKARRAEQNKLFNKRLSSAVLLWDSYKRGTYIKAKHGLI